MHNRYVFLTYPQCNVENDVFVKALFQANHPPERYYGCKETHKKTGSSQFHVLMDLGVDQEGSAPNITDKQTWDIKHEDKVYHPNISKAVNVDSSWHYVNKCKEPRHQKHGPGVTFGDMLDPCSSQVDPMRYSRWHYITEAATKEEFLARLKRLDPEAMVTNWLNIEAYMEIKYPKPTTKGLEPNIDGSSKRKRV